MEKIDLEKLVSGAYLVMLQDNKEYGINAYVLAQDKDIEERDEECMCALDILKKQGLDVEAEYIKNDEEMAKMYGFQNCFVFHMINSF
jgi:hypothetical protein